MQTFNKKGDGGETSLLYGVRVAKCDDRCEVYGTIDEAVSMLGVAKNFCQPEVKEIISSLQRDLFFIGTELAVPQEHYSKLEAKRGVIKPEMVQRLEELIDDFETKVTIPREFVLPGDGISSSTLDVARTMIRRAERRAVAFKHAGKFINEEILKYLNRLADLIFILARYEEKIGNGSNSSH